MTTNHNFILPITTEKTLRDFVSLAFGVHIPDVKVCKNHTTPWRAFADAYFSKSPVSVWYASRGLGGKTFLEALLCLTEAMTLKADINALGGSGEQSKRLLEHLQIFMDYPDAPHNLLIGDVAREMSFVWGNSVHALMASQASVRGPHPQKLRCDEVDEIDLSILDAALGQPMRRGDINTQVVLSSTWQYPNGTMSEVLRRAGERKWPVYEWCYKENLEPHGWLLKDDVIRKQADVTAGMWATEYELQEPAPSSRAIQPQAIENMFNKSLGEFEGAAHEYIEIEPPQPGASYATGADWARKSDWTIIPTYRYDINPVKCVAWERTGRLDWPVMVGKLDERNKRYEGISYHDGTGLGDVVNSYLTTGAISFIMAGRDRANLLSEYIAACEHGEVVYPFIRWAYNEHKFASVEDVFGGAGGGHLPDSISGGALAWRGTVSTRLTW